MHTRVRRALHLALLATVATTAACTGEKAIATNPDANKGIVAGSVTATRVAGGIELYNGTERGIAYVAVNPNWLGTYALCADPGPSCVRLAPGARTVVPESEWMGWAGQPAGQQKLSVHWWHVIAEPGGYRAGAAEEIKVIE